MSGYCHDGVSSTWGPHRHHGEAGGMAKDVERTLRQVNTTCGHLTPVEADAYVRESNGSGSSPKAATTWPVVSRLTPIRVRSASRSRVVPETASTTRPVR